MNARHLLSDATENIFLRVCILLTVIGILTGCAGTQARHTSNLVEFLYPGQEKESVAEKTPIPALPIPFRMVIAFVPDALPTVTGGPRPKLLLDEKKKADLMEKISASMKKYPFVHSIESIPSQYLVPKAGFTNLDQIRKMYGADVITLLSYDQVQHTDEGLLSIFYWTVVGAYIIEGEKNDTSTMIDAAAFYIPDRRMLFRAAGTSHVHAKSTPINLSEQLRKDSYAGFEKAVEGLVGNLQAQLVKFREKIEPPAGEATTTPAN